MRRRRTSRLRTDFYKPARHLGDVEAARSRGAPPDPRRAAVGPSGSSAAQEQARADRVLQALALLEATYTKPTDDFQDAIGVLIRSRRDLEQAFVGMQFVANVLLGEVAAMKGVAPSAVIEAARGEVLRSIQP